MTENGLALTAHLLRRAGFGEEGAKVCIADAVEEGGRSVVANITGSGGEGFFCRLFPHWRYSSRRVSTAWANSGYHVD